MAGDRWRGIKAGHAAGRRTIFIDFVDREKQSKNQNFTVTSIYEAAQIILSNEATR